MAADGRDGGVDPRAQVLLRQERNVISYSWSIERWNKKKKALVADKERFPMSRVSIHTKYKG